MITVELDKNIKSMSDKQAKARKEQKPRQTKMVKEQKVKEHEEKELEKIHSQKLTGTRQRSQDWKKS